MMRRKQSHCVPASPRTFMSRVLHEADRHLQHVHDRSGHAAQLPDTRLHHAVTSRQLRCRMNPKQNHAPR